MRNLSTAKEKEERPDYRYLENITDFSESVFVMV